MGRWPRMVALARVDADGLEDRRRHVAGFDLALGGRFAVGVSLAVAGVSLLFTWLEPRTGRLTAAVRRNATSFFPRPERQPIEDLRASNPTPEDVRP